jgi:mRNA interferase MazF
MTCRRGDIVLVLFPDSNLRTSKLRPALVVQADQLDSGLSQTIVAMITSNMARAGHPSRVVVRVASEGGEGSGLLMDSVIMTDNLATVRHSEIDRVIGTLPEARELDAALRTTLAL